MDLKPLLTELGLNEKEIRAYLACLELGESAIMPIVHKTGLVRTSLIYILEKLRERGLLEIVQHQTHRRYLPLPPRKLLTLIQQQESKLKEQAHKLEHSLPELNRLYASTPFQPRIRVFKDLELRELYEDMTNSPINQICYVGDTTNIADPVGDRFLRNWIRRRAAKGIHSKAIRIKSGERDVPEYVARQELLRTVRYAPDGFESPAVIYIYGDNVAVVTTAKESFGVVTTSREYAKSMQNWFDELWKISSVG